jgi:CRISPR-associated protein Csm1
MKKETYYVTAGALLHDIGKIIFRTGGIDSGAHGLSGKDFIGEFTSQRDILEAIHYHHKQDIQDAGLSDNSLAYLVYIADNISSGLDRRKIEGETKSAEEFNQDQALSSVFNILNNNNGQQGYIPYILAGSDSIIYPQELEKTLNSEQYYNRIYQGLKQSLKTIVFEPEHINSLLEL